MATCLNLRPRLIRGSLADACQANASNHFWRELFHKDKPYTYNYVVLPCGRCINCLKKKQDSYVVRIQEEAKKRGNLSFVTLTYREDTLPWRSLFGKSIKKLAKCRWSNCLRSLLLELRTKHIFVINSGKLVLRTKHVTLIYLYSSKLQTLIPITTMLPGSLLRFAVEMPGCG